MARRRRTHRELIQAAIDYVRDQQPDMTVAAAINWIAGEMRVQPTTIYQARDRNKLARWHHPAIERITDGKITEADFRRADSGRS